MSTDEERAGSASANWRRMGKRLLEPFPEVDGNEVRPMGQARSYFSAMLRAIRGADETVDLEMYLWDHDDLGRRFRDALRRVAARGVQVRVLVDGYGASEMTGAPLRPIDEAGGNVRVFNPVRWYPYRRMFRRTHKKLLIVDGNVAFCGGMGLSDAFSAGKNDEPPWRDHVFRVAGPIVEQLITQFEVDFARWGPRQGRFGPVTSTVVGAEPGDDATWAVGTARGRVLRGWPDERDFPPTLLDALNQATGVIRIGTPYFVPRLRLLLALSRALKRGVDVHLIVPAPEFAHRVLWHGSRRYLGPLIRRGAQVRLFEPSFYHAKIAVIDDQVAIFGSSNLDGWSWRRNAELDLRFSDPETTARLTACFDEDWEASRPLTRELFRGGGLWNLFAAWIAARVRRWM